MGVLLHNEHLPNLFQTVLCLLGVKHFFLLPLVSKSLTILQNIILMMV